jgi:hypothetical protein
MKRHENEIHHLPKKCPYCYRAIRRLPNLRLHVKAQHGTELGTLSVGRFYNSGNGSRLMVYPVIVDNLPPMDEAQSLANSATQGKWL